MRLWVVLLLASCSSEPTRATRCTSSEDCPAGRCSYGTCLAGSGAAGDTCDLDSECATKHCVGHRCETGATGAPCVSQVDCASELCVGERCAADNIGAACTRYDNGCRGDGVRCIQQRCSRPGGIDTGCEEDADCTRGLSCIEAECQSTASQARRVARQEEAQRREAAATEARMLRESGVTPSPARAERTVHPPGPGARVRTAQARGSGSAFAACRDTERLVGGGCDREVASYPSEMSAEDTVGARWNCVGSGDITAFALCMKLP